MSTADLIARVRAAAHSIRSRRLDLDEDECLAIERAADALEAAVRHADALVALLRPGSGFPEVR